MHLTDNNQLMILNLKWKITLKNLVISPIMILHTGKISITHLKDNSKAVVASLGGTALGDIALVPAINLKNPKGIRGVEEWYISTLIREDFIKEIYDRQTDIAIENLKLFMMLLAIRLMLSLPAEPILAPRIRLSVHLKPMTGYGCHIIKK